MILYFLTFSSALLYVTAFVFPTYFFWLVFFFLVPLFYGIGRGMRFTFIHGFWWGLIFFCIHWFGLSQFIVETGLNNVKFFAVIFLALYWACCAGVWFIIGKLTLFRFPKLKGVVSRIVWFAIATFLYFFWLAQGMWWWCGRVEGDLLSFPLLPLTEYPQMLFSLPHVGRYGLLLFLLMWQVCFSLFLCRKKYFFLGFGFIFLLPFLIGIFVHQAQAPMSKMQMPKMLKKMLQKKIGYVSPRTITEKHPIDRAQEITYKLAELVRTYPEIELILMPESTYNFSLNKMPEVLEMWESHALQGRSLVLGAHREEEGRLCNTAFVVSNNVINQHYDKNKLAPFTEKVAKGWNSFLCVTNMFLSGEDFCEGTCAKPLELFDGFCVQPLICSELFMGEHIKKCGPEISAYLVLVNDAIFAQSALRDLLHKVAIFKALETDVPLIYVGHFFACFITSSGSCFFIKARA